MPASGHGMDNASPRSLARLIDTRFRACNRSKGDFDMTRWLIGAFASAALFTFQAGSASAGVIALDAAERGFITQAGATNPMNLPPGDRDYLLGNCALASCFTTWGGEYRDFFGFAIPLFSGTVTSVELQIDTVGVDLSQSPTLTANFASLNTTSSFAALGTGTTYGSTTY